MSLAITYKEFGGPEVLEVSEVEVPSPKAGQVRVRVRATSVNPLDIKMRSGAMASAPAPDAPVVPGLDAAGVVEEVGEGRDDLAVGDDVVGTAVGGSYATHALMEVAVLKPDEMSWEEASCVPTVGEAAYRALGHLNLSAGETVLIHGAAGSVGAIASRIAISRGVTVIGSMGEADISRAESVGVVAIKYGDGLLERVKSISPDGVDAVLDTAGHDLLPDSIELAGGPERVVTIADLKARELGVRFTGGDPDDRAWPELPELLKLVESGEIEIPVWKTYQLEDAAIAHSDIEAGRNRGKIVLLCGD